MGMDILIVDDDPEVVRSYSRLARAEGLVVESCADGEDALRLLAQRVFSIVVLDVHMPRVGGLEVCREMRTRGDRTPVLVLTAEHGDQAEIEALEAGADDFVCKTGSPDVFVARVNALLRRGALLSKRRYTLGRAVLDEDARTLSILSTTGERGASMLSSNVVSLSQMEVRVLAFLASRLGQSVSRDELLEKCWGAEAEVTDNALAAVAARLRHRLDGSGITIRALRGRGMHLEIEGQRHGPTDGNNG